MAWTMSVASRESFVARQENREKEAGRWIRAALDHASRLMRPIGEAQAKQRLRDGDSTSAEALNTTAVTQIAAPTHTSVPLPDPTKLTARISHDLRTPLNAVLGFSELMRQEAGSRDPDCRYRAYAERIQQSGEALLKATEETLVVTQMIAEAANQAPKTGYGSPVAITRLLERLVTTTANISCDRVSIATLGKRCVQVEGCEAAYNEAFRRLVRSLDQTAPRARHALSVRVVDDQLLVVLETPADEAPDTLRAASGQSDYPLITDTLDLLIVQTMFALQGAEMSWVTDRRGRHLTARVLIPLATQWSLPLDT